MDFGCGVGKLYRQVADFFPTAVYTGVDLSKDLIQKTRSRFQGDADFQEHDSNHWEENVYDLILSAGVFHHIPHVEHTELINKISSLLNQGGRLVIWEHNPLNPITQIIVKDCPFDEDAVLVSLQNLSQVTSPEFLYQTFRLSIRPFSKNFYLH